MKIAIVDDEGGVLYHPQMNRHFERDVIAELDKRWFNRRRAKWAAKEFARIAQDLRMDTAHGHG